MRYGFRYLIWRSTNLTPRDNLILPVGLMADLALDVNYGERCMSLFHEWHPDRVWMDRHTRRRPGGDKVKIIAVMATASLTANALQFTRSRL